MKTGDTVQVTHLDGAVHWIYATVIVANEDGSALVKIDHPGNIEDGTVKFMPAGKIRTKASLQTELDGMKPAAGENGPMFRARQASLFAQLDRLS